jgi:hypothetical protein
VGARPPAVAVHNDGHVTRDAAVNADLLEHAELHGFRILLEREEAGTSDLH